MSHRNWKLALRPRLYGTRKLLPLRSMTHFSGIKRASSCSTDCTLARPRTMAVHLRKPSRAAAGGRGAPTENKMEAGASHSETPSCLTTCDSDPPTCPPGSSQAPLPIANQVSVPLMSVLLFRHTQLFPIQHLRACCPLHLFFPS